MTTLDFRFCLACLTWLLASACHSRSLERTRERTPSENSSSVVGASLIAAGAALDVPKAQIFEPSALHAGERRPLLIFLHGLGSSGRAGFDALKLAEFGAKERVFVVAPDGSVDSLGRHFWNASEACCNFDRRAVDDVARLGRLLDRWIARPDVDPSRVYVMGHSNGGFMTQRLACALGDRIAAAVSLAGAAPVAGTSCVATKTLAVLEVHGDEDAIVRYTGGTVFDNSLLAAFSSAQQGLNEWAERLACVGPAQRSADLDLDPRLSGAETQVQEFTHCAHGSVHLWTVHGGSHTVGMDPHSFQVAWGFMSTHQR